MDQISVPRIEVATKHVKVQDLSGKALDWAVAKALGCELVSSHDWFRRIVKETWSEEKIAGQLAKMNNEQVIVHRLNGNYEPIPAFSRSWAVGGPLLDRWRISINYDASGRWSQGWRAFSVTTPTMLGETGLIAAMRSYVASKLGEVIEVPACLLV
ncbi:phage protein NinX family protein [Ralstonia pseudosolanacearum]|uniref:phage protein NinX family protein n=1 Tax=Ralstonia pseudosolanacearum TaxID=1310165 RepID=UPI003CF3E619